MAKEILAFPEEGAADLVQVIRVGLANTFGLPEKMVTELTEWCDEWEEHLAIKAEAPGMHIRNNFRSDAHSLVTGAIAGALMLPEVSIGLERLAEMVRGQPVMRISPGVDERGDYTNVIDFVMTDQIAFTITVDQVEVAGKGAAAI